MNNWIVKDGSVLIFENCSLLDNCIPLIDRAHTNEAYTALKVDDCYRELYLAIFVQALSDYLEIGVAEMVQSHYLDTRQIVTSAQKYIESLDSLWFLGCPSMSGKDLLRYIGSDYMTFAEVRMRIEQFRLKREHKKRKKRLSPREKCCLHNEQRRR